MNKTAAPYIIGLICLVAGFLLCNLVCTPTPNTPEPVHTNTFLKGESYFDTLTKTEVRIDTLRDTTVSHEYSSSGFQDISSTKPPTFTGGFNLGSLATIIMPAIARAVRDTTQTDGHVLGGIKMAFHPITAKFELGLLASIDINKFTAFVEAGYFSGWYFAVGIIIYLVKLI